MMGSDSCRCSVHRDDGCLASGSGVMLGDVLSRADGEKLSIFYFRNAFNKSTAAHGRKHKNRSIRKIINNSLQGTEENMGFKYMGDMGNIIRLNKTGAGLIQ